MPALSRNLPALHDALVKAEPTYEAGDFQAALALAKRLLGGAGTLYVFSDFQKSNWEAAGELPAGILCRLRPVTTEPVNNVAQSIETTMSTILGHLACERERIITWDEMVRGAEKVEVNLQI